MAMSGLVRVYSSKADSMVEILVPGRAKPANALRGRVGKGSHCSEGASDAGAEWSEGGYTRKMGGGGHR